MVPTRSRTISSLIVVSTLLLSPVGVSYVEAGPPDNIPDIVFANIQDPSGNLSDWICMGSGQVTWACRDLLPADHMNGADVAVGDINGDQWLDVVIANPNYYNQACINDGMGSFTCANINGDTWMFYGIELADVNHDTKLDVLLANENHASQSCLGQGDGTFVPCTTFVNSTAGATGLDVGDINSDGNEDVVLAHKAPDPNQTCLGDGTGQFLCSDLEPETHDSTDVVLGDLNGDELLDAVFANYWDDNQACLGVGDGTFSCQAINTSSHETISLALGDLNGDSQLDAVFGSSLQPSEVCFGDGIGGFACSAINPNGDNTMGVAIADMNGDGFADLVLANQEYGTNNFCLNDGSGSFACSPINPQIGLANGVAIGDFGSPQPPPSDFHGFFQPVDNLPTLNTVNAGRAIPVKFSLGGDKGLNIFAPGYPRSTNVTCGSVAEDAIEQTVTAGASNLTYDAGADQYSYVWKTEKAWSGTCRTLIVKFADGNIERANFKFK